MPVQATCQQQIIRPCLGQSIYYGITTACHKAMLAGQRSSRGLRRWSRLGKRCTQAQCPRPPGAALRPFPRPASVICGAWCVCVGVCVTVASAGGGAGDAVLCGTPGACLQLILMPRRSAPCPFREAPLTAHSAPPALRATGINTNNCVRGRGRGSGAGGWGRGQGEAVWVRVYMHTHPILVSRRCNIQAIVQNMCSSMPVLPQNSGECSGTPVLLRKCSKCSGTPVIPQNSGKHSGTSVLMRKCSKHSGTSVLPRYINAAKNSGKYIGVSGLPRNGNKHWGCGALAKRLSISKRMSHILSAGAGAAMFPYCTLASRQHQLEQKAHTGIMPSLSDRHKQKTAAMALRWRLQQRPWHGSKSRGLDTEAAAPTMMGRDSARLAAQVAPSTTRTSAHWKVRLPCPMPLVTSTITCVQTPHINKTLVAQRILLTIPHHRLSARMRHTNKALAAQRMFLV